MSLESLLETYENNNINVIEIDEHDLLVQEAFLELNVEDMYDSDVYDDSYENMLNIVRERADDIIEGKYTLEEAIKFEEGLDKFIPTDTSKENIQSLAYRKVNIMQLDRMFNIVNEMLTEFDIESIEDDSTVSLEEQIIEADKLISEVETEALEAAAKGANVDPNKHNRIFGGEKSSLFKRASTAIVSTFKAIGASPSKALSWLKANWKSSAGGKARSIGSIVAAVLFFCATIMLFFRKIRMYRVNYSKQSAKLNNLSGTFNGDKSASVISKSSLDSMINSCKKVLGVFKSNINNTSITDVNEAKSKFNAEDLSTLGIRVSKGGKAKFGKAKKEKKKLSEHGYGASDFNKYKKTYTDLNNIMIDLNKAVVNSVPGNGGRGTRAMIQIADKAYRFTMTHVYTTALAIGYDK